MDRFVVNKARATTVTIDVSKWPVAARLKLFFVLVQWLTFAIFFGSVYAAFTLDWWWVILGFFFCFGFLHPTNAAALADGYKRFAEVDAEFCLYLIGLDVIELRE